MFLKSLPAPFFLFECIFFDVCIFFNILKLESKEKKWQILFFFFLNTLIHFFICMFFLKKIFLFYRRHKDYEGIFRQINFLWYFPSYYCKWNIVFKISLRWFSSKIQETFPWPRFKRTAQKDGLSYKFNRLLKVTNQRIVCNIMVTTKTLKYFRTHGKCYQFW